MTKYGIFAFLLFSFTTLFSIAPMMIIDVYNIDGPPLKVLTVTTEVNEEGKEAKVSYLIFKEEDDRDCFLFFDHEQTVDFITTLKNNKPASTLKITL